MKVAVTGAGSNFARVLMPRLCADSRIAQVIGVAPGPAHLRHEKLRTERIEMRDPALHELLAGCDALIHLYFASPTRSLSADERFELNVRAAHKLFHAARERGVKRLIHVSTAAVYGSAVHANEDAPLKPIPGFTYAEHQAHLEQLLAIDFPDCVRLRPHIIVGSHAHPLVKLLLKQPFYSRFAEPDPLYQCVHEDDVAEAVMCCLGSNSRGAYNLAIDKSFTLRGALRTRHRLTIPLPALAARRGIEIAARCTHTDVDNGWMSALSRTLLVNCRRAIIDLGWKPLYTAQQALRSV